MAVGLRKLDQSINAYNAIKNTRFWLPKEVTKEAAKKQAKRKIAWDIVNIANPIFRNGGRLDLETAPAPPDGWRPKAKRGIGVTNDKGDNFYVEEDGTDVNENTGQRGSIGLDEVVVRPRTYASSFDGSLGLPTRGQIGEVFRQRLYHILDPIQAYNTSQNRLYCGLKQGVS